MPNDVSEQQLWQFVCRQLDSVIPPSNGDNSIDRRSIALAVARTNHCVSHIKANAGRPFDRLNSGHYATFLYFLANTIWKEGHDTILATRIFLLNKALNGIDLYFEVTMPDIFLIGHTVGMVFAKASYANGLVFHQGCTVGRNGNDRPTLECNVILYPNSSVIGRCVIRENTVISPGVQLVNMSTPGNCLVFSGEHGRPVFRSIDERYVDRYLTGAR